MEKGAKKYIVSLLSTGHRHESMTGMWKCDYCGDKFKKAEKEYNRLQRQNPEAFKRKLPEYTPSPELIKMREQLGDRLQRDPLYKKHIELSFKGTPAERQREEDRANSGYYTRHSNYQGIRFL